MVRPVGRAAAVFEQQTFEAAIIGLIGSPGSGASSGMISPPGSPRTQDAAARAGVADAGANPPRTPAPFRDAGRLLYSGPWLADVCMQRKRFSIKIRMQFSR